MKISDILAVKGRRIVTVNHHLRADAIPQRFDENGIGSLLVVDGTSRPLGIVTDRLFMKALAGHPRGIAHLQAADIMESPAPWCTPETSVSEAMRIMTDKRIRHLLVVESGRPAGIVSIGDLVKSRLGDYEMESRVLREMALGHLAAG
jgi:CBS domain-containing protein